MRKIFFFFLMSIFLGSINSWAAKSTKKCSPKNLETLYEKTARLNNIAVKAEVQITKIFMNQNYLQSSLDEVRSQIFEIQKDSTTQGGPLIAAIESLLEKHPECDKKKLFR